MTSSKDTETVLKRIGHQAPKILGDNPLEVFVPLVRRDLDVFELSVGTYILVRSVDLNSILRLKTITGCKGLVTVGESGFKYDIIRP